MYTLYIIYRYIIYNIWYQQVTAGYGPEMTILLKAPDNGTLRESTFAFVPQPLLVILGNFVQ